MGPFKMMVEATGGSFEDLVAIAKEIVKDLKAGYTTNVGGKRGGSYVYCIKHDTFSVSAGGDPASGTRVPPKCRIRDLGFR